MFKVQFLRDLNSYAEANAQERKSGVFSWANEDRSPHRVRDDIGIRNSRAMRVAAMRHRSIICN